MSVDILVIGQGLAGTLLAWELEKAGLAFEIADAGHAGAASIMAAGIVNPITGRRLVKNVGVAALLPVARAAYRELEAALGVKVWREMRVRRLFADERERRVLAEKQAQDELAPFLGAVDGAGFWIEGAAQVDLGILLPAARERWCRQGRLREEKMEIAAARHELIVDCSGLALARGGRFEFVPWRFSKGEMLEISVEGLAADTVLNDGHWILPVADGMAWVGATHEPGVCDGEPTVAGRAVLEVAARRLLGRPFRVVGQRAGVRVNLPDKLPVVGRHPTENRWGLINGLGAKGVLFAPTLAQQWVSHLAKGVAFDARFNVARFVNRA